MVNDVQAAASFYQDVVGLLPESHGDGAWAWFQVGEAGGSRLALHRGELLFEEHSPRPAGDRWGAVHFGLHVDRDDLAKQVDRVRDHGVEIFGPVHLSWMAADSYYFFDPDGNLVEFWSPDPPEADSP